MRRPLALLLLMGLSACSREPRGRPASPTPPQLGAAPKPSQVVLAQAGVTRVAIVVPPRLLEVEPPPPTAPADGKLPKKAKPPKLTREQRGALVQQQRLAAAVKDLAKYLSRMAASTVRVVGEAEAASAPTPILIAELASKRLGPVAQHARGGQAYRYVVAPDRIALVGESDLATSYAIYELLDRLGCRWFMPGELGEDIPHPEVLALPAADELLAPATAYRGLWYADEDFQRRNRLGGIKIAAGHMLERWITPAERDEHPEWRAEINGVSDGKRLRWSNPEVATAIAGAIDAYLERRPGESVSLSPLDGSSFDESVDRAIDANDWDPTTNHVSLTDRLLVLANRVAERVTQKRPEIMLGLLAYTSYTRPPVREKVHPSIVPVIAPISYCRPHAISDDACPGAKELRQVVQGWAERSARLAFRGYAYNLAEPAAPNPMLRKWSFDLPFLFRNKVEFFQPETLPNFETSLPALWLGIRLSWKPDQTPEHIIDELFTRFYGHASGETRDYLDIMDRAWAEPPIYSGGALGYARRFPPELMKRARLALDRAVQACKTDVERERLALLDQSLRQLELYMRVDVDFRSGRMGRLGEGLHQWLDRARQLGDRYAPNSAFGKTGWAKASVYGAYGERFLQPIYAEGDRIAREQALLTAKPLCTARYRALPELKLPIADAPSALPDDPTTDFCLDTWSSLGHHDYFGAMRYELDLPPFPRAPGKSSYLWLSKVDGVAQAWVNGVQVRPKGVGPANPAIGEAHLKALTFDISAPLHENEHNRVTVVVQRTRLAELGAGGLLGPAYAYRDR